MLIIEVHEDRDEVGDDRVDEDGDAETEAGIRRCF